MSIIDLSPVGDASAWRADDVLADRGWELSLDAEQRADLVAALRACQARELQLAAIGPDEFPLPSMTELLATISAELQRGRGFALLHGFPVEGHGLDEIELMYWGMCRHLGMGLTQNSDATLIHYVTEGRLRPNQGTRGVGVARESTLHVDLTDCVSLLCVRQAPDDPPSWLASSTAIFNEMLESRPDLLDALIEGFEWDRLGEHGPGESPTSGYRVPVFSVHDGVVSCRYNRYWMAAAQRRNDTHNTPAQREALDLFDRLAARDRLEFAFNPGDVQFANNYVVLHGRAAHEPIEDEDRVRLLMRIWIDFPEARPMVDEAIVRYGVVRHGNLGWTADQVAAGTVGATRERRADGAIR